MSGIDQKMQVAHARNGPGHRTPVAIHASRANAKGTDTLQCIRCRIATHHALPCVAKGTDTSSAGHCPAVDRRVRPHTLIS